MGKYLLRRILGMLPLLLGVSVLLFVLLHAVPGGPFDALIENPQVRPGDIARLKAAYGLDRPVIIQYVYWLKAALSGNWGFSYMTGRPVMEMIAEHVIPTIQLTGAAFLLALVVAVPMGVVAARKKYSATDYSLTALAFLGISMPVFWFALMLQLLFSVKLGWLPSGDRQTLGVDTIVDQLTHMIMPAAVLSLAYIAGWSRYIRSSFIETLSQDYIRTARSKGLSDRIVTYKHALRNAFIPVLTIITLDLPALFSGAVITETVFSWPGMGRFFYQAVDSRDYPVLMGLLIIGSGLILLSNLLADIGYSLLDPRIKYR